jgi:transcriptional regulator with GAF, ATPase, and Fis domain
MATQLSFRKSRFDPNSPTTAGSSALETSKSDAFRHALAALTAQRQEESYEGDAFLRQVAKDAQYFTAADSAVIALGQPERIVCLARSGSIGPALGAPLDTRSGISGECLRQRSALRCEDTETDPRVDAQLCRMLGIRSLAVVPVFESDSAIGVLEVFSSQPKAFQDHHLSVLEKLAALIAGVSTYPGASLHPSSEVLLQRRELSPRIPHSFANERRPSRWAEAFQLRPYQFAIMAGFLLLDLATIYWQLL